LRFDDGGVCADRIRNSKVGRFLVRKKFPTKPGSVFGQMLVMLRFFFLSFALEYQTRVRVDNELRF
jgi:hypothetical protein